MRLADLMGEFVGGNFREEEIWERLERMLPGRKPLKLCIQGPAYNEQFHTHVHVLCVSVVNGEFAIWVQETEGDDNACVKLVVDTEEWDRAQVVAVRPTPADIRLTD